MYRTGVRLCSVALGVIVILGTACKGKEASTSVQIPLGPVEESIQACADGDTAFCRKLAWITYRGDHGVEASPTAALDAMKKCCDKNDPLCCHQAGNWIADGVEGKPDIQAIAAFHKKACSLGEAGSCNNLANLYLGGQLEGGNAAAFPLLQQGCDGGDRNACANLAAFYDKGIVVEVDRAKGFDYTVKACELEMAKACLVVAKKYELGRGVEADPVKRAEFMKKACALGEHKACAVP